MRYTKNRRDANEDPIVDYLRACGYRVKCERTPFGADALVRRGTNPVTVFLEIKTKLGRLTENQIKLRDWVNYESEHGPYVSARTPEDALREVQRWI